MVNNQMQKESHQKDTWVENGMDGKLRSWPKILGQAIGQSGLGLTFVHMWASWPIPKYMELEENLMFDPWRKVIKEFKCDIWLEVDSKNVEKWESYSVWTKWHPMLDFRSTKHVSTCVFLPFSYIQRPNDDHLSTKWRKLNCPLKNLDNCLIIGWRWHGNKHMNHT